MKHTVKRHVNNHIVIDIFDDSGQIIIGDFMTVVNKSVTDIDAYVMEHIYPIFDNQKSTDVEQKELVEVSKISKKILDDKDKIKLAIVQQIKTTPSLGFSDIVEYVESNFGWDMAGIALKLMKEFCDDIGLCPDKNTKEDYFTALKQFIVVTDIAVLQEMID